MPRLPAHLTSSPYDDAFIHASIPQVGALVIGPEAVGKPGLPGDGEVLTAAEEEGDVEVEELESTEEEGLV